jgi:hypothetical protein
MFGFVEYVERVKRALQLQHDCLTAQIPINTRGKKGHVSGNLSFINI